MLAEWKTLDTQVNYLSVDLMEGEEDLDDHQRDYSLSLSPPPPAPQPSLGLGLLRNLLPLKMAEFLGGLSTIFFFTG
jgi:hypothetical protein